MATSGSRHAASLLRTEADMLVAVAHWHVPGYVRAAHLDRIAPGQAACVQAAQELAGGEALLRCFLRAGAPMKHDPPRAVHDQAARAAARYSRP
jgi:hypothetical protein